MSNTRALIKAMRPPFLMLTPVCVFLGYSAARFARIPVSALDTFLVLTGALAAHISVNTLNEYHDFRSGLDARTVKTPFSGGSGALVENPDAAPGVFLLGKLGLVVTIVVGVYFTVKQGIGILPLGILGVLIVLSYTPLLNRSPFLCLVAPGVGFGPLMVAGADFVLTGHYSSTALLVSLVPFFLTSNLLLLNQYPDIQADRSVGRRHFPIFYGTRVSTLVYGIFSLAACTTIAGGVHWNYLPQSAVFALVPMAGAMIACYGAWLHADSPQRLSPYLAMNVLAALGTPLLLGFSLFTT